MKTWQKIGLGLAGAIVAYKVLRPKTAYPLPGSPCFPNTKYVATCSSGKMKQAPSLIVIHSAEGSTAAGVAGTFLDPNAGGSTHLAIGEDGVYQFLPFDAIACGAQGVNERALHIELAGYASWTRTQWLARQKTLDCAAYWIAYLSDRFDIPVEFVDAVGLKARQSGVTTHIEVNRAYKIGNHWDPGPGFPMDVLLAKV